MSAILFSLSVSNAFATTFDYYINSNEITITGCTTDVTEIEIPKEIDGYPVTVIGDFAFDNCKNLKNITIPDSIVAISCSAFDECSLLTDFYVDTNNTNYCSVNGVLFNKSKTTIVRYPLGKSNNTYTIPNYVSIIDYYAFYRCNNLESITVPNSLTTVLEAAFFYCPKLTNIYYNDTKNNWDLIDIRDGNRHLTNSTIHYAPCTETIVSNASKTFTVNAYSINPDSIIILATYNKNKLAEVKCAVYEGSPLVFTTSETYTKAKVMVWDSLKSMLPIIEHEDVQLNSGGEGVYIPPSTEDQESATYTVSFKFNNGDADTTQTVTSGSLLTQPDDPTKQFYIFTGWYTDVACTNLYNFTTPVTGSFTLYAGWEEDAEALNAQRVADLIILKDSLAATTFDIQPHTDMANLIIDTLTGTIKDGESGIIITDEHIRTTYASNSLQIKDIWENQLFVDTFVDEQQDFKDMMAIVLTDAQSNRYSMTLSETYRLFRVIIGDFWE